MQIKQVIVTGKNEVSLQTTELDVDGLAANELVIKTESSFISAGTELANYTATDQQVYEPGSWCAYPWKAGYANVGIVLEAGAQHRDLIGQRVFTNGVHASVHRYATDLRYKLVAPVPSWISPEEAVALRMAMVAMAGLDASKPQYIRWVVVIGLGMVGNLAAQLFHLTGAQVIGIDPSETRRRLASACGIPHVITGSNEEIAEQVRQITRNHMADVAVDAVGHSAISLQALRLTARMGEVIVLGTPRQDLTGNLTEIFSASHRNWISVKGAFEWSLPTEDSCEQTYTQQKKLEALFRWVEEGRLKLKPLITHVLPPEEIKVAYEGLLHQKETYVGVVLNWT